MHKHIQMPCYHYLYLYLIMFFMQLQGLFLYVVVQVVLPDQHLFFIIGQ